MPVMDARRLPTKMIEISLRSRRDALPVWHACPRRRTHVLQEELRSLRSIARRSVSDRTHYFALGPPIPAKPGRAHETEPEQHAAVGLGNLSGISLNLEAANTHSRTQERSAPLY